MSEPATRIHPTAVVEDGAQLADDTKVGPYAVIASGTVIGPGCEIGAHAILHPGTILEEKIFIDAHAVIGGDPQDIKFDRDTPSGVYIGAGTTIREHVTINRATRPNKRTVVGPDCFLLATCHVPHDATIGQGTVIANAVLFGGFVEVGSHCFIGGSAVFHQHVRIGDGVMVSGNASLSRDIAPYILVSERDRVHGLNHVGLRRRGFSTETVSELKRLFRAVLDAPGNVRAHAARQIAESAPGKRFLSFFGGGKRGFVTRYETRRRTGGPADT